MTGQPSAKAEAVSTVTSVSGHPTPPSAEADDLEAALYDAFSPEGASVDDPAQATTRAVVTPVGGQAGATRRVSLSREGGFFRLAFPYSPDMVAFAKALPYAAFDPETKTWTSLVCTQSLDALRMTHRKGDIDVDPDSLLESGEEIAPVRPALVRPGTLRRPFLVQMATRDDRLYSRLTSIPGARWERNAAAVSYPPTSAVALGELIEKGVIDDPERVLNPAGVTVAYDSRNGEFVVRGDQRASAVFAEKFPQRDVMAQWQERGLDVAFVDEFSHEVYRGELARHGDGIQPDGMAIELYDYQRVDVAVALERSGLLVGHSMGVGKCIHGDSRVWVNGTQICAEDIWEQWAGEFRVQDGQGEWAIPTTELVVHSVDHDHQTHNKTVTRLYRQKISEKMRRIRLSDGNEITITQAHRLLREDGAWTTNLVTGMRVAVPRNVRADEEERDLELVRFLAWLIAEGSEERREGYYTCTITQKDTQLLTSLKDLLLSISSRYGISVGRPAIRQYGRRAAYLSFSGRELLPFLERHCGYSARQLSATKQIPPYVLTGDSASTRLFLREFFTAEGSAISDSRHVEITTASHELSHQLTYLAAKTGFRIRWRESWKRATNGSGTRRPYRQGRVAGHDLRVFAAHVGFSNIAKAKKLEEICSHPANDNLDCFDVGGVLREALTVTGLPMVHLGIVGSADVPGRRQTRSSLVSAIAGITSVLDGTSRANLLERRAQVGSTNQWMQRSIESFDALDENALNRLASIKDELTRHVHADVAWAEIVEVEEVDHDGYVYDLEVPELHNYVAEGIYCHNTAIAIALGHELVMNRHEVPRVIVVVPAAVRTQWRNEIVRFTGCDESDVVVIDGDKKKRMAGYDAADAGAKWVVVHYQAVILAEDRKRLDKLVRGALLVADECHRIKNHQAKSAKVMAEFAKKASRRLGLSGTPVENHPGEWFNILSGFVSPGVFGSATDFLNRYSYPGRFGGYEGARNLPELRDRSKPLYIRRTLAQVADHLPSQRVETIVLEPRPEYAAALKRAHREARDEIAGARLAKAEKRSGAGALDGYDRDEIETGAEMTAVGMLKLLCSSPLLIASSDAPAAQALRDGGLVPDEDGPKLDEVRTMAAEMAQAGDRLVIFSGSKRMANLVAERLEEDGVRCVLFTGDSNAAERDEAVRAFTTHGTEEDPGPTAFVATDAGAEGLNLGRCCSTLVNLDIPWTPGRLAQRNARVRRVDSDQKSFLVVNLVLAGTLELGILRMVEHKADLADAVLGESGGRRATTGRGGRNVFEAAMAEWGEQDTAPKRRRKSEGTAA